MSEKKVVIIDDDTRNIFALKATLRARQYDCQTYTEAMDALKQLPELDYDIILII